MSSKKTDIEFGEEVAGRTIVGGRGTARKNGRALVAGGIEKARTGALALRPRSGLCGSPTSGSSAPLVARKESSPQADITLVNLNMLIIRYKDGLERELHVTLGPLYLAAALERAGFSVDFRDYQLDTSDEPFSVESILAFCADPAPIIGLSCMANLLPFTILAARALKEEFPDRTIVLGGVGPSVRRSPPRVHAHRPRGLRGRELFGGLAREGNRLVRRLLPANG